MSGGGLPPVTPPFVLTKNLNNRGSAERPQPNGATEKRERIEAERSEALSCEAITKTSQFPKARGILQNPSPVNV